jgi:hypothetical protein
MIIEGGKPRIPGLFSRVPSIYGGSTKYGGPTNCLNLLYTSLLLSNPPLLKDDSKLLIFPDVGRPFADTICMILVIIRMRVLAEKRKELSQTIASLIGSISTEKGGQRCDFFQGRAKESTHNSQTLESI